VLEHWPVSNAVREFIANALDEHEITGTELPKITKIANGEWRVRDFGRGLRYQHLTQNEDPEKLSHPRVIGQFGIGLKDALAVCHRRGVGVVIRSRHGTIRTTMQAKAGFSDVVTLHAAVSQPDDPEMIGTEAILRGVADGDVEEAMSFFLRYSGDEVLEETKYGEVLDRSSGSETGRVYVRGLLVAEEPNFLFSYNITELNAALRRALNRERANVGRVPTAAGSRTSSSRRQKPTWLSRWRAISLDSPQESFTTSWPGKMSPYTHVVSCSRPPKSSS
jgi:hypothetical protein